MSLVSLLYNAGSFLSKYKVYILVTAIFLIITTYIYIKFVRPKLNKTFVENREFVPQEEKDDPKFATLYYFYTNWCPLSKQAKPEWVALQSEVKDGVKGVNIIFKEIDCDQDTAQCDAHQITGYPTIKLVYNNKTYEYDAKPNKNTLITFLNSVL